MSALYNSRGDQNPRKEAMGKRNPHHDMMELEPLDAQSKCVTLNRDSKKSGITTGTGHIGLGGYIERYCNFVVPKRKPHRRPARHNIQSDGMYEESMRFCPPPLTMISFSIIQIIAFVFDIIWNCNSSDGKCGGPFLEIGLNLRGPAALIFIYNPLKRYEVWRFCTYMFVHKGITHLVFNLTLQIFFGIPLELVHRWWRVALIYLAGVLTGSLASSVTQPNIRLVGASGGVYALLIAHVATIILNWKEMDFPKVLIISISIICSVDVCQYLYYHLTNKDDRVSYIAHLGGGLAGLLVGIFILRNLKERKWERIIWWIAIVIYVLSMICLILFHIFVPGHFPQHENF